MTHLPRHDGLDPQAPARVYRNLNRGGWSIRQAGRVQDWRPQVSLTHVTFRVRPSGRDRVRQGGHKQVHAWATGLLHVGHPRSA